MNDVETITVLLFGFFSPLLIVGGSYLVIASVARFRRRFRF